MPEGYLRGVRGPEDGYARRVPIVGLHHSHEQIAPSVLLEVAQAAEAAGFQGGMSSDHFSPWSARQGESGDLRDVPRPAGDARRLRRVRPHGARPRHPRDRRPRHEPHLRRAPLDSPLPTLRSARSSPSPGGGPEEVNVARQRREPDSLLNWLERLIRRRQECPELGWGACTLLGAGQPSVLAHRSDWDGSTIVAAHNLGGRGVRCELVLADAGEDAVLVELPRNGARWYRLRRAGQRIAP
jgi:hypothetical protein